MDAASQRARTKVGWNIALVFIVSTSLSILLRSGNIMMVDGAFRCLEVFRRQTIFFHSNNHMLYPVDVLLWNRLLHVFGITSLNARQYFAHTQLMNCVAGGGCLGIIFYLTYLVSSSQTAALGVVITYGLSKAFLLHATNSAEPLVGVFWSLVAIIFAVLAVRRKSDLPIIISAVFLSLAMATYQSTILLAPAAIVLIWKGRSDRDGTPLFSGARWIEFCEFALTGITACAVIFGRAYWLQGYRRPEALVKYFFAHGDARAYLGVGFGKSLNIPIGFVRNIFPLAERYTGIRNLLAGPKLTLVSLLLVFGSLFVFLVAYVLRLKTTWKDLAAEVQLGITVAAVGLAFTIIPVIIWDPHYDKLWLQPLACLAFAIGCGLEDVSRDSRYRFWMARVCPLLVLAGVSLNLIWATQTHEMSSPDLEETQRLANYVGSQDLVVGDWDAISTLYGYGWAEGGHFISFPGDAVLYGPNSLVRLRDAIEAAQKRKGRVYFLSILDDPKTSWDSLIGSRCGVPYADFELYRRHSIAREKFYTDDSQVVLRQYDPAYPVNDSQRDSPPQRMAAPQ